MYLRMERWFKKHIMPEYTISAMTSAYISSPVSSKSNAVIAVWITSATAAFFTGTLTCPIPCRMEFVRVDRE